jgi:lipoic acid synthetase
VEVLVPDFQGSRAALETVMEAGPDVLNHNIETVPRLYRQVRPGARYEQSLRLIATAHKLGPSVATKSGMMLGLGEARDEIVSTMRDLVRHDCQILTLGQYLRPSLDHLPIARYVTPDEFSELKYKGERMGFAHVEAGPLVRSSYHAGKQLAAVGNSSEQTE